MRLKRINTMMNFRESEYQKFTRYVRIFQLFSSKTRHFVDREMKEVHCSSNFLTTQRIFFRKRSTSTAFPYLPTYRCGGLCRSVAGGCDRCSGSSSDGLLPGGRERVSESSRLPADVRVQVLQRGRQTIHHPSLQKSTKLARNLRKIERKVPKIENTQ